MANQNPTGLEKTPCSNNAWGFLPKFASCCQRGYKRKGNSIYYFNEGMKLINSWSVRAKQWNPDRQIIIKRGAEYMRNYPFLKKFISLGLVLALLASTSLNA
ncbi:MAG: hypothetical protein K5773_05790, partial [Pseudobutyrivibrio sp.]|nr:hypothetical protein [Pseudobutyrivibrio sp.]